MSINIPTAFSCKIRIPYGELKDVLEWCDRNCTGEFKYSEDPHTDSYSYNWIFFFEHERDYLAFIVWKK